MSPKKTSAPKTVKKPKTTEKPKAKAAAPPERRVLTMDHDVTTRVNKMKKSGALDLTQDEGLLESVLDTVERNEKTISAPVAGEARAPHSLDLPVIAIVIQPGQTVTISRSAAGETVITTHKA